MHGTLDLADTLWQALMAANALDGEHATEKGGTYGAVRRALLKALTVGLQDQYGVSEPTAHRYAYDIYRSCIESGEAPSYSFFYWEKARTLKDVRKHYGKEAARNVENGWTVSSAIAHATGTCDRELCGGEHKA